MTFYQALKTEFRGCDRDFIRSLRLHVKTSAGELGVVEDYRHDARTGYVQVTLRHFNGEAFDGTRVASACTLLARR